MEASLSFDDLYADLVAANTETLPESYFTLAQFCADAELTERVGGKRLARLVDEGRLGTRLASVDGRRVRIWWFAEGVDA